MVTFSQAEFSTRNKYGGTGPGLAVSRHFCRTIDGDLTVESAYGPESIFTALLPAVVSQPVSLEPENGRDGGVSPTLVRDAHSGHVSGVHWRGPIAGLSGGSARRRPRCVGCETGS